MEKTSKGRKQEQVGVGGTEGGRSPTGVPTTPTRPVGTGAAASGPVPSAAGLSEPGSEVDGLPTAANVAAVSAERPDPQVLERPVRRTFDRDYKLRILQEADACTESGQVGALLRREGLYSSHLAAWRRQRTEGTLAGLAPKRRGRKAQAVDPLAEENHRLRRENERLATRLKQAETIIEVQKKVSEILGIPLNHPDRNANDD
jgi:transposase